MNYGRLFRLAGNLQGRDAAGAGGKSGDGLVGSGNIWVTQQMRGGRDKEGGSCHTFVKELDRKIPACGTKQFNFYFIL